jgi:hypothetical protein
MSHYVNICRPNDLPVETGEGDHVTANLATFRNFLPKRNHFHMYSYPLLSLVSETQSVTDLPKDKFLFLWLYVQPIVGPWPPFQHLNPVHSR